MPAESIASFSPIFFYLIKLHRAVCSLKQMLQLSSEVESDFYVKENSDGSALQVEVFFGYSAEA